MVHVKSEGLVWNGERWNHTWSLLNTTQYLNLVRNILILNSVTDEYSLNKPRESTSSSVIVG